MEDMQLVIKFYDFIINDGVCFGEVLVENLV
jgi:hypothetical protein